MAGADYYDCDICGCKTFYDARLEYDDDNPAYSPDTHHRWPNGNVGMMIVICKECAKTHDVIITKKPLKMC